MSNTFKEHYNAKSGYGISRRRLNAIISLFNDWNGKLVLDIGCGNGHLGKVLKTKGAVAQIQAKAELRQEFPKCLRLFFE